MKLNLPNSAFLRNIFEAASAYKAAAMYTAKPAKLQGLPVLFPSQTLNS